MRKPIPTLEQELATAEREYWTFLMRWTFGDVAEAAKIAGVPRDGAAGKLERLAIDPAQFYFKGRAPAVLERYREGSRGWKVVKGLEGGKAMHLSELHRIVGGSYGALGVLVSHMKRDGLLVARGQRGQSCYALAAP